MNKPVLFKNKLHVVILFVIITPMVFACTNRQKRIASKTRYIPNPNEKIVGFMIDAARTMEKPEFYKKTIDFCADWGYNAILFRLTDDQGSSYCFESHPELITHKNALSKAELKALVEYAENREIDLIPEIESFGHTWYITSVPQYAHLDDSEKDPDYFNAITPVSDTSLILMKDMFTEVSEIFTSRYIHMGCDETNWGANPITRKALETTSKDKLWAEYVNKLHGIAQSLDKESIIWGDMVTRHHKEAIRHLNKDIIIMDWIYWDDEPSAMIANGKNVLDHGFRLMGAPAINSCAWGPRVSNHQLENIQAFRKAHDLLDRNNQILGWVVTNWFPSRYIPNGQWDTYALGAMILNSDTSFNFLYGLEKFFTAHFGITWNEEWDDLISKAYKHAPPRKGCGDRITPRTMFQPMVWRNDEEIKEVLEYNILENSFAIIFEQLSEKEIEVENNLVDYKDFALSFKYLSHTLYRNNEIIKIQNANKNVIRQTIADIALKDSILLDQLIKSWDRARPEDSPLKSGYLIYNKPHDALLATFQQATSYSRALKENPHPLIELIATKGK